MITIDAQVIGAERVIARLDGLPPRLMGIMQQEISRLTISLLRYVKERKLSGSPLRNKTGTLRRKINQTVQSDGQTIVGTVGVKLSYAAAHEFGFKGPVTVKAHLRRCKEQMKAAFRLRPLKAGEIGPRQGYYSNKGKGAGEIQVRSFTRNMNLPERSFLRSALREMDSDIRAGLQAAVKRAVSQL